MQRRAFPLPALISWASCLLIVCHLKADTSTQPPSNEPLRTGDWSNATDGLRGSTHHASPAALQSSSSDDGSVAGNPSSAVLLTPSVDALLESARKTAESAALHQLGQLAPVQIISSVARWQTKDDRMNELEDLETAAWSQADVIVTIQVRFAGLRRNVILGCKGTQTPGSWATSILQTDIQ